MVQDIASSRLELEVKIDFDLPWCYVFSKLKDTVIEESSEGLTVESKA
jgi:hypothetical protein